MLPLKNVCRRASSSLVRFFDAFLNPVHPRSISSHMGFEVNTWLWFQLQPIAGLEGVLESSRDAGHALAPALLWCFVPDRCEHRRKPRISSRKFPGGTTTPEPKGTSDNKNMARGSREASMQNKTQNCVYFIQFSEIKRFP
jgi:hypothetical protein